MAVICLQMCPYFMRSHADEQWNQLDAENSSDEAFLRAKCARESRVLGHHMRCTGLVTWYLSSSTLDLVRAKSGFDAIWRPSG